MSCHLSSWKAYFCIEIKSILMFGSMGTVATKLIFHFLRTLIFISSELVAKVYIKYVTYRRYKFYWVYSVYFLLRVILFLFCFVLFLNSLSLMCPDGSVARCIQCMVPFTAPLRQAVIIFWVWSICAVVLDQ